MNDFMQGITQAAGDMYKKKALSTLGVFVGGGVFGVLAFAAGWVVHG